MDIKHAQRVMILCVITLFNACTTLSTVKYETVYSDFQRNEIYQVRVRTGNITLDRLTYETASHLFGRYLKLASDGPVTGYIDITFTSTAKELFSGSSNGYTRNIAYGNGWYTGDSSFTAEYHPPSPGSEIVRGTIFTWQKSIMQVIIQDKQGTVLWAASHGYSGGTEQSGLHIKTSDNAAAHCLSSIISRFESDYGIHVRSGAEAGQTTAPFVALIVNKRKPSQYVTRPATREILTSVE